MTTISGVSDEDLARLYGEAEVAIVPSLYEGFSLPAIEAMSCGVPVVATTGGALPEVRFHERQFSQLLEKLLGNALRYRANRPLRIEISATREGEWQKFSVADNGIGIREEYLEQIFGVFKRLHRDEYLAGVGLAVCKKIVERQGGRIWAESAFGRGSTFFFTIPASPPDWRVQAPGLEVR